MISSYKCYQNNNWVWGYRENDPLGEADIYSSSKAYMKLMILSFRHSYANSNTAQRPIIALAGARAGNVIGGGDWAEDRLIPDIIKAIVKNKKTYCSTAKRNTPLATRARAPDGLYFACREIAQKPLRI